MNGYEKFIAKLKERHGENSKSISDPDWNQITSWTGYVPDEMKKVWIDIPYETKLLLYHIAVQAYRNG